MCNLSELYYKRGYEKGYKIGYEEGYKIGYEEGLQEIRTEEKIEVAFELYKQNTPIEVIATATKLSVDEINKLIKSFGS